MVIGGVAVMIVGLAVMVGFRVGSCVDGATYSSCTSSLDPRAVVVGLLCLALGAFLALRAVRRPK